MACPSSDLKGIQQPIHCLEPHRDDNFFAANGLRRFSNYPHARTSGSATGNYFSDRGLYASIDRNRSDQHLHGDGQRYRQLQQVGNVENLSGNHFVEWESERSSDAANGHRDSNARVTFTPPLTVGTTEGTGAPVLVQIAVDTAGDVNLLWVLNAVEANLITNVFFSRSTDGGKTFSKPLQLSPQSMMPQLVVEPGGDISVIWGDLRPPGYSLCSPPMA
jgi:hypothetical protein